MLPRESPFSPLGLDRIIIENRSAVAFLDGYPIAKGHTLVAPKQIVKRLDALPPRLEAKLWEMVRQVRALLIKRYHPDAFTIGVNDGLAAGQTIAHAHIHIVPRYENDVADPRGGIRWVIPKKANYWKNHSGKA